MAQFVFKESASLLGYAGQPGTFQEGFAGGFLLLADHLPRIFLKHTRAPGSAPSPWQRCVAVKAGMFRPLSNTLVLSRILVLGRGDRPLLLREAPAAKASVRGSAAYSDT